MYACKHTHVQAHMYTYSMYVHMYVYMCTHVYMNTQVQACMNPYMYTHMYVYVCMHTKRDKIVAEMYGDPPGGSRPTL